MVIQNKYDVIIIGAGLAGIACAIRLRKKGKTVLVIEKNATFGGKLAEFEWNGYRWDKGPSIFTEPNIIEELFELCGKKTSDYFNYKQQNGSCTYYFPDSTSIDFCNDREKLDKELRSLSSENDRKAYYAYIESNKKIYDTAGNLFISNPIPGAKDLLRPSMIKLYPALIKRQLRKTLHKHNSRQFESAKMVQIFDRFGTYNGSNPYQMSGLFSMISHLELDNGTYAPTKGMRSIPESLYRLSLEIGVDYVFNETGTATEEKEGFNFSGTKNYTCNALVCAIDHIEFYSKVLKNEKLESKYKKKERSTSGLVFYWAVKKNIPQLGLHNLFFGEDYKKESETLWVKKELYSDPNIYINISSKVTPTDAPENGGNWFVMINTPAGKPTNQEYRVSAKKRIIDKIKATFDIDITENIEYEEYWDCSSIEAETGSYKGAIYGASSNEMLSTLKRHKNKSSNFKNLYFCGGTVHPGGGIPLVLRSAKIVASYFK